MKNILYRLVFAASLAAIVQTASADIFVSDGFMVSSNTQDVNQELLTSGRQTGTLYPATYDGWQEHHQVGNNGTDVGQPGGPTYKDYVLVAFNGSFFSDLDIGSLASGPLTNEFDMYQKQDGSTEWGACALRFPGSSFPIAGAGEFGFLQRRNGGVQAFQNGGNVPGTGGWDTAGFTSSPHWKLIFSDTNGTGSAFNGNGSRVTMINGATTLGTLTLGQLRSKNLRLGFNASGNGLCGIDNLTIYGTPAAPLGPNLSFEYDALASGNVAAFTSWHRFVDPTLQGLVGGTGGDFGSEFPATAEYSVRSPMGVPADGNQFLFLNMNDDAQHLGVLGGVYQDMGPMIPNHTYTLTVAIGSRQDRINSPGVIELVNGTNNLGTVLATGGGLPATQDTWQDYTVTYTTGPTVSGDLTICLGVVGASTIQADFDNVRLDFVSAVLAQNIQPTHAETFVGDQVVFTAAYSNDPPVNLQWQQIVGPVTNNITTGVVIVTNNGVVTSTLTLNNVQLTNAGSYRLEGFNATNGAAAPSFSAAASLAVSAATTVGNILQMNSGQSGPPSFYPPWTMNTNADLIFGFSVGAGNAIPSAAGSFALDASLSFDPSVLSDGNVNSAKPNMCSCGWAQLNPPPGESMTYTLPTTTYGYTITNITVYGGWTDDGRNEQKYQVLYSTVAAPSTYVSIGTFDYNPSFTDGQPNATRVILVPVSGALAQNVASVQLNFNMQSKNNWNGYSEITLGGTPALGVIPAVTQDIAPLTAEDVVGSKLTMTGAFSGATSYQWQKNGTNLVSQTSPTLTLSNLQPTDTATNGGYRLLGINVAGTNYTRGCTVVVDPAPVATNNVITAVAYQTSDAGTANPFSSTWDTSLLGGSLIAGQNPPTLGYGTGNFNDPDVNYPNTAGGLPVLTDGSYGTFAYDGSHPAFATCGTPTSSAGQYVAYLLGANANGYNITNIQIAGGWNDDGRDSQFYTILYSTVSNPNMFVPLTSVANNLETPRYGVSDSTVVRTTFTPATGVLASNVYGIEVDFQYPQGVPHGYSGYSEISVFGSPSATPPVAGPVITTQHEETSNIWTVETPNLIGGQLPSSQGPGVFTGEGCNVTNLTDGILGFGAAFGAACGDDPSASVSWIAFTPTNGTWNLTNIVVYTLWTDYGRDGQFYNVSYSTQSAPATFLPLASVAFNPFVPTGVPSGNRVQIAPPVGQSLLASNVAALKFDFTPQGTQDFNWSGYTEIVLQGTNVPAPIPPVLGALRLSNGNLIVTGAGGTPNAGYTWYTTTNLVAPVTWTPTAITGNLDGAGAFSNAIPVNTNIPDRFFRLHLP